MPKKKDVLHLRLDLKGDILKYFNMIREDRGLTNATETLRLLIMEECKRMKGEER